MTSCISIDSSFETNALCILSLLSEQDMSSYQIGQEIARRSNDLISAAGGSICITLYRLEDNGFISHTHEQSEKNQIYHMEQLGYDMLSKLKKDYYSLQKGIDLVLTSNFSMN